MNGMDLASFEERVGEAREAYCNAISEALDQALLRFLLPGDRISLLQDAAMFTSFMIAIKAAEVKTPAGQPIDRRAALKEWWPIEKKIKAEVAPMLLEWGREAEARKVEGSGEVAS